MMNKSDLKIGKQYMHTVSKISDDLRRDKIERKPRPVTCIGIYPHHARFDFGGYARSLTWFDVGEEITEVER